MNPIDAEKNLRTAVHGAVEDVTAGFDMFERVRGGVRRRQRRMQIATTAAAVVAIAAGGIVAGPLRHGGSDPTEGSKSTTSAAGVTAPDCSHVLGWRVGVARNDEREHDGHFVPGTPVVAVVCPIIEDTRPLPSKAAIGSVGKPTVLRGDHLKQVVAALNTAELGSLYVNVGPPLNTVTVAEVDIIFRYGDSGTDIGVNVPLYDNRVAMVESPSDIMAHFSPKPIPDVLKALAGAASG